MATGDGHPIQQEPNQAFQPKPPAKLPIKPGKILDFHPEIPGTPGAHPC